MLVTTQIDNNNDLLSLHFFNNFNKTDGQTEWMNQILESYLCMYTNYQQDNWADLLPIAEFTYNNAPHSATQVSPFFANHGRHPNKGTAPRREAVNESAGEFADRMKKVREETESALRRAAETMKRYYDRHKGERVQYKIGDKVWLEGKNITTERPMKKLDHKNIGPFTIVIRLALMHTD